MLLWNWFSCVNTEDKKKLKIIISDHFKNQSHFIFNQIDSIDFINHTTQHNTTQHNITQQNITQHNTTQLCLVGPVGCGKTYNTTQHNTDNGDVFFPVDYFTT